MLAVPELWFLNTEGILPGKGWHRTFQPYRRALSSKEKSTHAKVRRDILSMGRTLRQHWQELWAWF